MSINEVAVCSRCQKEFAILAADQRGRISAMCPACRILTKRERQVMYYRRQSARRKAERAARKAKLAEMGIVIRRGPKPRACLDMKKVKTLPDEQLALMAEEEREINEMMLDIVETQKWKKQLTAEAKKAAKRFDQIITDAAAAGMSYGIYQSLLRKQREEGKDK